ncbi:MAG TPA: DNA-3-methyladenine glycosylase [Gemmatimonadales bacterium]
MIVARDLLGRTLASDLGGERVSGIIVETEAYLGVHDVASHAWRHRRRRETHGVFAPAGTWYIYRSYGIHWCLNITAPTGDDGGAVLIRAIVPRTGLTTMRARRGDVAERHLANGPGKVGQILAITGAQNGMRHTRRSPLRLTAAHRVAGAIDVTPRIGISQAVEWPLRFLLRTGD